MLKRLALIALATVLVAAASIPTPSPKPSQPTPQNIGVQGTPQNEPPAENADHAASENPSIATGQAANNDNSHPAKNEGGGNSKSAHDLFDYFGLGASIFIGLATIVVLIFQASFLWRSDRTAGTAARAALATVETMRHAERAYIQISHVGELMIFPPIGRMTLNLQLKNWGKTPGTATGQLVGLFPLATDAAIPPIPQYDLRERERTDIFLVPSGTSNWEKIFTFPGSDITDAIALVEEGHMRLLLLGYVDYMDKFGGRYRAGYAREYIRARNGTGNNLVFVTAPDYNYDRERRRGEGRDWNPN